MKKTIIVTMLTLCTCAWGQYATRNPLMESPVAPRPYKNYGESWSRYRKRCDKSQERWVRYNENKERTAKLEKISDSIDNLTKQIESISEGKNENKSAVKKP